MATCERYPPKYPPACSTCSTWMALVIATLRISPRHRCSYLGFDGGDFIRDKPFDGVSKKKDTNSTKKQLGLRSFSKRINLLSTESMLSILNLLLQLHHNKNQPSFSDAVAQSKSGFQKSKPTWRSLTVGLQHQLGLSWHDENCLWNCYHPLPSWSCFESPFLVGSFKHDWIIFHFIYGMSSFPLTNSIIFQRGRYTTNQFCVLKFQQPMLLRFPLKKWKSWGFFSAKRQKSGELAAKSAPSKASGAHQVVLYWGGGAIVLFFWRGDLGIEHGGLTTRNIQKLVYM